MSTATSAAEWRCVPSVNWFVLAISWATRSRSAALGTRMLTTSANDVR